MILIWDSHLLHTNLAVVDFCKFLWDWTHTHSTMLSTNWCWHHQQATAWQHNNTGKAITKIVFGGLLKHAWNLTTAVGNATNGFKNTGIYIYIYPLNPNAKPAHKFVGDSKTDSPQSQTTEMPSTNEPFLRTSPNS